MPGLKDDLQAVMMQLKKSAPEIRASAFVSLDGLMLASATPAETNTDSVAAMSATVLGLGERTTKEFATGELEQVYFKGSDGYIILQSAGDEGVLVVVTEANALLGILFLLIRKTASEIRSLVRQALAPTSSALRQGEPPSAGSAQPNVPWGA